MAMNVLIVDDQASQRMQLRHLIEDINSDIKVSDFADPVQALLWSQQEPPDLVVLDYRMPKMDGLEFARRFRRPLSQRDVPMMLITVVGDDEPLRQAALDAGIIDFLVKPIKPREVRARCKNMLDLRQRQQSLKSRTHLLENQLISGMHQMEQRERDLFTRLARVAMQREGSSVELVEKISRFSGQIAKAMGLSDKDAWMVEQAAMLHDIGNIGIPDAILSKHGQLADTERAIMQQHTILGHEVLRDSSSSWIEMGAGIALNHHERWNGTGYPRGLSANAIPLPARIVAVADVLDALTTPRPYRETWDMSRALDYVNTQSGVHFDPDIVSGLMSHQSEIIVIHQSFTFENNLIP